MRFFAISIHTFRFLTTEIAGLVIEMIIFCYPQANILEKMYFMAAILNMQDGCFTRFCANANIDFLIGNSIKF